MRGAFSSNWQAVVMYSLIRVTDSVQRAIAHTTALVATLGVLALCIRSIPSSEAETVQPVQKSDVIGMYVHQHWAYKHPYAARTWSLG